MSRIAAALGTTPQTRELSPFEKFRIQINKLRTDIGALIGKDKVDTFVRTCLNAVQHNPGLLVADRRTLFLACMEAASDGLLPDGNEAVLNVYSTKDKERSDRENRAVYIEIVQYLPMAYGLVQKMYEIPGVVFVDAVAVNDRDAFDYARGDNPHIDHKPYDGTEDPGKVKAAYVVIKFKDRETKREVMFRRDIEKVRQKSKAPNGLMWKEGEGGFYDQGAIKSVIHRVFKQLPQAERLSRALAHDNKVVGLADVVAPSPEEAGGTNLAQLVDMTFSQELRDQALGGATVRTGETVEGTVTGKTQEGEAASSTHAGAGSGGTATEPPAKTDTPLPPPPKAGDPGTPELKAKLLGQMTASTSLDVLDIVQDEVRFYKWTDEDAKELKDHCDERRKAISGEG